jgi:hypothetical protein
MPTIKKTITDIISAPFNKYDKFYANLKKKEEAASERKAQRDENIYMAQEHERRKRGDLSGPGEISIAMREFSQRNKARGTDSSAIRREIK